MVQLVTKGCRLKNTLATQAKRSSILCSLLSLSLFLVLFYKQIIYRSHANRKTIGAQYIYIYKIYMLNCDLWDYRNSKIWFGRTQTQRQPAAPNVVAKASPTNGAEALLSSGHPVAAVAAVPAAAVAGSAVGAVKATAAAGESVTIAVASYQFMLWISHFPLCINLPK